MKKIYMALQLAAAGASIAAGTPFRTDINPAMQYYQAFLVAPDFSPPDRDYLFTNDWRGQLLAEGHKLPERFGELVGRYDNEFKLVRQAARSTVPCDWGIDMSPGPATLLPQLARNKGIAQAARLRVLWHLQQGRPAEARDDLLAAFVLGRNTSRDGTLISALVQIAIENIVCSVVAENFHRFPPPVLQELVDGFEAAPARGTVADCLATEKVFFLDWLVGRIQALQKEHPGKEAQVMAGVRELVSGIEGEEQAAAQASGKSSRPPFWDRVAKAAGGTSDGVIQLVREAEAISGRLKEILSLPRSSYEEQIKRFNAEIEKSANPFVPELFPAWQKSRTKELVIQVELAMVRAAAAYKLRGEPGLKSVADPCGQGPFAWRRFSFGGVDRGFQLTSVYDGRGFPEVMIFVEKHGPPFQINGQNAGQALPK